ncbi:hypothetical protein [Streptomyces sp. AA1529]|uniref:hypothetical protein n=1 Tax=Streptomyces sp. AA1529 TaxID=1203257 RepID=UPI0003043F5B|nr:hypothetical protein [Streptomyces sp. AA1529]
MCDDHRDEFANSGYDGGELCGDRLGEICAECGGCDCPDHACPGWAAHCTGTD